MSTQVNQNESFSTHRRFYDDKNYPRGMSRSGEYSINEVKIIESYGAALEAIANGTREPTTDEERRFKQVCDGEAPAQSPIEKAWLKYQTKVLTPKQFHTLFGTRKVEADTDESANDSDNDTGDINEISVD